MTDRGAGTPPDDDTPRRTTPGDRTIGAGGRRDGAGGGTTVDAVKRILDAAAVPTAILDGEGQIVALNPAFARLCGRGTSEVAGLHLLALCPGRDQADVLSKLVRIVGAVSDIEQEELRVTGADGRIRTLFLTLGGLTGADGRVDRAIAIASDLTEERRAQRRRRRESLERAQEVLADDDTGLPNRRALPVLIGSAIRRAGAHDAPFAVLRCEVTNVDDVERAHGAAIARSAMGALAERLGQRLRSADTVTRSTTDAFTVIAEDLGDAQDAAGVAYRLLASVVESVLVGSLPDEIVPVGTVPAGTPAEVPIEMVIGIAVGDGSSTPEQLLSDAAAAAAEARGDGVGGFRIIDARAASPA